MSCGGNSCDKKGNPLIGRKSLWKGENSRDRKEIPVTGKGFFPIDGVFTTIE
jgi:hypothetical protein